MALPDWTAALRHDLLPRFIALFGGRLAGAAAMFVANLWIARSLGATSLADFALLISSMGILSVVLGAGFSRVGTIIAAAHATDGEIGHIKGFVLAGARHVLLGTSIALPLFIALALVDPAWMPAPGVMEGILVTAGAAGIAFLYLFSSVMVGFRRQVPAVLPDALIRPVLFLLAAGLIAIALDQDHVVPLAGAYVATIWLAVGIALAMSRRKWREVMARTPEYQRPKWRRAAYPWAVISFSWDYLVEVIVLTAGILAQRYEVAILYVCFRFSVLIGFGMKSILTLFLPDLTALAAKKDHQRLLQQLLQVNLLSTIFVALVIVGFAVAGRFLLGLFGAEIVQGYPALLIIGAALAPAAIFGPAPQILAIHNKHVISATVMSLGMVAAVCLMVVLTPLYGIVGIAVAYAATNVGVYAVLWLYLRQHTGIDCSLFASMASIRNRHKHDRNIVNQGV